MAIFRYAGGKSRGKSQIISFIPDIDEVCSPFIGGGAVELELGERGIQVFGYDVFQPLVNCWQQVKHDAGAVAEAARRFHPTNREAFYRLQTTYFDIADPLTQAAAFFALNRSSFGGLTFSGGFSGEADNRFTKSCIAKLAGVKIPNLTVEQASFEVSLSRHPDTFAYLDPPYLLSAAKSNLYGIRGDAHRNFDHGRLAEVLRGRPGFWLLSYNDAEAVRRLYEGFAMVAAAWTYGTGKAGAELLILSHELAEAVGVTPMGQGKASGRHVDGEQVALAA